MHMLDRYLPRWRFQSYCNWHTTVYRKAKMGSATGLFSLTLFSLTVLFLIIKNATGASSWADKLKRRVDVQPVQQPDSNGDAVYYPFTVHRDTPNLCNMWKCREINRQNITSKAKSRYLRDRRPIVLTADGDSSVPNWKALKWNLWYWASKLWPVLNNVLVFEKLSGDSMSKNVFLIKDKESSRDGWEETSDSELRSFPDFTIQEEIFLWDFLYDIGAAEEKPMSEQGTPKSPAGGQNEESRNTELRDKSSENLVEKDFCRFYSQDYLEMEQTMKIASDTNWKEMLIHEELGFPDEDDNLIVSPLFNMLYPGCSLQFRYSGYHTTKVQIFGKSRYYLVSPNKLAELYPFPSTSESSRQLQINLYRLLGMTHGDTLDWMDSMIARSLSTATDLLEIVELSPGETLFVPPGYAVLAEAKSLAITIDILSPSREQVLYMEALMTPLPMIRYADQFNTNPPPLSEDERIIYTQVYLAHLISRIDGISSIGRYVRKLYKSRYSLQFPLDSLSMQILASSFDCYKNQPKLHEQIVKSIHPEQVEKLASFVAKKFNDPLLLATGNKWILLGDYVEKVVRDVWDTKSLEWVPLFLNSCLDIDSKIKVIEEVEGPPVMKLNPIY